MFRPIKNLLTYIQKNASSTAIFGGTTEASSEEIQSVDATTIATTEQKIDKEKETITESAEVFESVTEEAEKEAQEANTMNANKIKLLNNGDGGVVEEIKKPKPKESETDVSSFSADIEDIEDIETQIKSSVMLRKSTNRYNETQHDDENLNYVAESDENEDLKGFPVEPVNAEDFCSIDSSEEEGGEVEILVTDDEEDGVAPEAPFMDLTHEFDAFPNNELIVLNEPELNNSLNSDAVSEDPLAIDEFSERDVPIDETTNPLVSHNSTSSDILWISIDDIKTCPIAPDIDKDVCSVSTPPITPTATPDKVRDRIEKVTASTSLNKSLNDEDEENPEELRSEGSDSGLGSETSTLQSTLNSVTDTSQNNATPTHKQDTFSMTNADNEFEASKPLPRKPLISAPSPSKQPMRSNLKRRLVEVEDDSHLDGHTALSDVSTLHIAAAAQKKTKRSINFDNVQVFYFPRQQGFGCVPSAGGCTLGMGSQHISFKTLTLAEHAAELRRAHRQQLQEVAPRAVIGGSSSEDSEESEEDYLSEGSSDADGESSGFLQPVSPKQRRAILKAAGVRKIDASEKVECRDIRNSREVCGCTCRDFCDPETCACSQAGIKCQVDRAMFPCGCSRDACGNAVGRVEFNPSRVRTHFIHTIMRLEMECRHQQKPLHHSSNLGYVVPLTNTSASTSALSQMSSNYYTMQSTQSNYSSGYASPAYPSMDQTSTPSYFQQQSHQQHYAEIVEPDATISQETPPLQSAYQVDSCLEASLFSSADVNSTPSYGELIPSYGDVCSANVPAPTTYHATSLNYGSVSNDIATAERVSSLSYTSYNHAASTTNYLTINTTTNSNSIVSNFSSCAVPSAPPYGTATTTAASSTHYHDSALETTTAATLASSSSCSTIDGPTSFISLNSPVSSSSRLSAINNLLQHNRNTTAALVAVAHTTVSDTSLCATDITSATVDHASVSTIGSINIPPIESFANKNCIGFEKDIEVLPLLPTPITSVLNLEVAEEEEEEREEELKSNKTQIIIAEEPSESLSLHDALATTTSITDVALSALAST